MKNENLQVEKFLKLHELEFCASNCEFFHLHLCDRWRFETASRRAQTDLIKGAKAVAMFSHGFIHSNYQFSKIGFSTILPFLQSIRKY